MLERKRAESEESQADEERSKMNVLEEGMATWQWVDEKYGLI